MLLGCWHAQIKGCKIARFCSTLLQYSSGFWKCRLTHLSIWTRPARFTSSNLSIQQLTENGYIWRLTSVSHYIPVYQFRHLSFSQISVVALYARSTPQHRITLKSMNYWIFSTVGILLCPIPSYRAFGFCWYQLLYMCLSVALQGINSNMFELTSLGPHCFLFIIFRPAEMLLTIFVAYIQRWKYNDVSRRIRCCNKGQNLI